MRVEAHFWVAPGVEVMPGQRVANPPPRSYCVAVRTPWCVSATEEFRLSDVIVPQTAVFRLATWSPTGEVAHYELEPYPPRGWRWIAVDGSIHAERAGRVPEGGVRSHPNP